MVATTSQHLAACSMLLLLGSVLTSTASAGGLQARILDPDGDPVPEVAVYALPLDGQARSTAEARTATMNQHGLAFDPHLLVIETGTIIQFPNQDEMKHHVYSFSPAKHLNLSIPSQSMAPPQSFDEPGLVTLGCNIHDNMQAYVLIVDTPHFAKSDPTGIARIESLAPGRYELHLWTPRLRDRDLPAPRLVEIADDGSTALEIGLQGKLLPAHHASETSLVWDAY